MRFLDNSNGGKVPSKSILEVGVKTALQQTYFDQDSFAKRDGDYVRTKLQTNSKILNCNSKDLEW